MSTLKTIEIPYNTKYEDTRILIRHDDDVVVRLLKITMYSGRTDGW